MSLTGMIILSLAISALLAALSHEGHRLETFVQLSWRLVVLSFWVWLILLDIDTNHTVHDIRNEQIQSSLK